MHGAEKSILLRAESPSIPPGFSDVGATCRKADFLPLAFHVFSGLHLNVCLFASVNNRLEQETSWTFCPEQ